jgi:hypothetical protein
MAVSWLQPLLAERLESRNHRACYKKSRKLPTGDNFSAAYPVCSDEPVSTKSPLVVQLIPKASY